ncbi:D-alanyl-D-alanine carboxypeptidase/D-alanyl-D-alanine-endopeptidase [Niastella caeni]|uniref:D-alanyl-D-alanine carboxypeptidase/D-alanyl-D-alanine-endopeptidase n=1 Tax=Niastella caeni TaxID=2569763 RepID=A0A4S8I4M0_9BACT|nr:D-alanyl-D-alanine carboxypeptidase/D-alanyl-D-alanine-endopeptidase [Niastella caeni]THU41642.1 D-alanyl-D-alanine carboxypeptidase/D-alanyl-D-alanine-endopeptidase [Niastella caeni]
MRNRSRFPPITINPVFKSLWLKVYSLQPSFSLWLIACSFQLASCSTQRQISRSANTAIFQDSSVQHAHVGISLFNASDNKYLYDHNGKKYFVPASNIKLLSCYAALKYLGDSLPGIRYWENDTAVYLVATGDPSLLHTDFKKQPVIDFLQKTNKSVYITDGNWKEDALGAGWAWNDYNTNYMAERSALPVYGNMVHWVQEMSDSGVSNPAQEDQTPSIYSIPEINWKVRFNAGVTRKAFFVQRNRDENFFLITEGMEKKKEQDVPFITHGIQSALELLPDTIRKQITYLPELKKRPANLNTIFSQPTDSLLQPMMHRSDNFYAEQSLLMVSQVKLGEMNDEKIIDTLLKTDLSNLPQKPRWVDGSGLSRYNLFTPNDFVILLNKMQQEFGMKRLQVILPTGGRGTLGNLYKQDSNYIFAKTGTLSGVVALSGYLYTKKNKLLIFSVLINNHTGSAVTIRRGVEAFLTGIRDRY